MGIIAAALEQYESSKDQTTCLTLYSVSRSITRCTCLNGGFIVELNALVNVLVLGCVSDFPLLHTKHIRITTVQLMLQNVNQPWLTVSSLFSWCVLSAGASPMTDKS